MSGCSVDSLLFSPSCVSFVTPLNQNHEAKPKGIYANNFILNDFLKLVLIFCCKKWADTQCNKSVFSNAFILFLSTCSKSTFFLSEYCICINRSCIFACYLWKQFSNFWTLIAILDSDLILRVLRKNKIELMIMKYNYLYTHTNNTIYIVGRYTWLITSDYCSIYIWVGSSSASQSLYINIYNSVLVVSVNADTTN